jgi:hypothetical protein
MASVGFDSSDYDRMIIKWLSTNLSMALSTSCVRIHILLFLVETEEQGTPKPLYALHLRTCAESQGGSHRMVTVSLSSSASRFMLPEAVQVSWRLLLTQNK